MTTLSKHVAGLLACAFLCFGQSTKASIVYAVDIISGTEILTGTITTDGVTGLLQPSDFLAWTFSATGPIVSLGSSSGTSPPLTVTCGATGCGILATVTELEETNVNGTSLTLPFSPTSFIEFSPSEYDIFFGGGVHPVPITSAVIGTITPAIPEPASVSLLGIALACLAVAWRRAAVEVGWECALVRKRQ
jgi:hypothetical protein